MKKIRISIIVLTLLTLSMLSYISTEVRGAAQDPELAQNIDNTQITTDPAAQNNPAIHGDRIVWYDYRNGNGDIYMYDLSTNTETPITTDPASQYAPVIHGDRIVWFDYRNGNGDIYMYDLSTGTETQITTDPASQNYPAIHGDCIVWQDYRNGNWDIYMNDTSTGIETQITTNLSDQSYPAIYGDCIVWQDYRNGNWDIYMHELPELVQFIYGINLGPVNLDPHKAWEISSFDVIEQVVEPLYAYDLLDPELAPIPRLASDFGTWSIDGLNYTVPLRMGVTFHDGTPFDATAVKWNFDRLAYFMNIDGPLFSALYLWPDGTPIINNVEIVDDYTVKFVLNKPFAPFEALLCFSGSGIMSPASTPQYNYIDTVTGDLVGTGPFVYDNYEVGVEVTMHAYENYWAGAPYIDELTFSIIPNTLERNQALLDGIIDFIKTPIDPFFQAFRDDPDITLVDAGQDATIRFLGMNNRLINVSFREAISYAINYTYMIDELLGGEAVRLKSPIPLGIMYANWSFNVPILNLTRARQVMQSMGFGVGFDVNIDTHWEAASFISFNYTYNIGPQFRENMLVLLQDNLGKIGITVVDARMTWTEYVYRLSDISPYSRNHLELFWLGWISDFNDPSNIINSLFSKNSVSNFAQVDDDLVQQWMEEALITINPAERKVLYDNIQQRLIEEVFPWAWGFVRRNYDAYSSKFTGFQSNPMDKVWFYPVSSQVPDVNDYIQDIPNEFFVNNAEQRKNALSEKLNEVIELINNGMYEEAILKLKHDIRPKCDGSLGGNPRNDWITDEDTQQELCAMIDALIAFLEMLI